ncbi:hypothetical protein [Pilimelia columellifera]|uniref:Uncharacterized protein n=1 Tax=Pilimelia columellifera subsp. columellifera TaxID=706583 RepID=A0ABP6AL42_9ACTN
MCRSKANGGRRCSGAGGHSAGVTSNDTTPEPVITPDPVTTPDPVAAPDAVAVPEGVRGPVVVDRNHGTVIERLEGTIHIDRIGTPAPANPAGQVPSQRPAGAGNGESVTVRDADGNVRITVGQNFGEVITHLDGNTHMATLGNLHGMTFTPSPEN